MISEVEADKIDLEKGSSNMNEQPVKTIGSKLLADVFNVGLEIGVGYLYFSILRKVSPWIKIPVLMVANRLLVTGLNAGIKKFESMR